MSSLDSTTLLSIQNLLDQAGQLALKGQAYAVVQYKADRSPVTDVELAIDRLITSFLRQTFPNDQILSEESGASGASSGRVWVLDPIDGTRVYINGLPTWGILLGLLEEGQPKVGFFNMAKSRDLYWGGPQYGAFLNGRALPPCPLIDQEDRLAFLAAPTNFHLHYQITLPRVRALGSTAANCCYCAQGSAMGVLTRNVSLWDVAGVLPILEATGIVCEFLSGHTFIPSAYLDGQKMPEELLIGHPDNLSFLRQHIHPLSAA